ncbi:MAG TPA: hypothetical protein VKR78_07415 [Acidimicrobiales bacterium]|nr:hypothetical protein [Acidimicrobiales bacterium]
MSVPVPLEELAAALGRRSNAAYLLTVGDDGRAHCVATTVEWMGGELVVRAGGTSARNAAGRGNVVLLAPPRGGLAAPPSDEDGYSLIVDADVTAASSEDGGTDNVVRVRPTHAVLHRPSAAPGPRMHDCVHVYDKA